MAGTLAEKVEHRQEVQKSGKTMDEWLSYYSSDFASALPASVDAERFLRLALNELRWQPALRECDVASVIGAMMTCAQLGLEPSGPLNHVYLTPRNVNLGTKQNPQWVKRVQLTIGYQGYIELAQRTGAVKTITADVVKANDDFDFWVEDGEQRMRHRPVVFGDRGDLVGAYAVARMVDGSAIVRAVDLDEIHSAKQKSDAGRADKGPWVTDFEAMAMKTAVRRLWKWLPKTGEAAAGYNVDGTVVVERPEFPLVEQRAVPVLDVVSDSGPSDEEGKPEPEGQSEAADGAETGAASDDAVDNGAADSDGDLDPERPFDEAEKGNG